MSRANRREFLRTTAGLASLSALGGWSLSGAELGKPVEFDPSKNTIAAPSDPAQWPAFRDALARWREETRAHLKYTGALYDRPEFAWSAANYSCCFLMTCDETFYDHRNGCYTVDPFLDQGEREFGGYDSVVLWHAYPRIGVDDRNQFDFYRDLPGGLAGLREVVEQLHRRNVRAYIDYNPWDTGTRREEESDVDALVEMVRALSADGIFLDTMVKGAAEFRAKLDATRPGVILEGEGAVPLENIEDHHASWAQHFDDSQTPGVLRHKWLQRRHMQHQIRRWVFDHTGELHTAWMNGSGMMVWENVFGSWVGWNARDRSLLRAMLPIQRRYRAVFSGEGWTPLVATEKPDVYASLWAGDGLRLWTLVNRAEQEREGELLKVDAVAGERYFDLNSGRELQPRAVERQAALAARIPARGLACFLAATATNLGGDFEAFLAAQAATGAQADHDTSHPRRETRLTAVAGTVKAETSPAGMVAVTPPPNTVLTIVMRPRECGFYDSNTDDEAGFWHVGSQLLTRTFERPAQLQPFAIDETPVTNAQFAEFLQAASYRPRHPENFLEHWSKGKPPQGKDDHPVVYVDLDDARAYARWTGKRLPTEEEWQYAAQGSDGCEYPWGSKMRPGCCNSGETGGTTPVKAFPAGRSPCGCYDMCGNVWQWTESERSDGRTRFCILRGGSYFAAKGSNWYVDGGPRPVNYATKFLLTWPGLDRCATIGFRCVVDIG